MNIGRDTLCAFARLDRINSWLYAQIKPFVGKRVLEAGCGNGNLTYFLLDNKFVVALDYDPENLNALKIRYANNPDLKVVQFDLGKLDVAELAKNNFDTVVCVNTLEHVKEDAEALSSFCAILPKGGTLVLLVPALQWLYCSLDKELGHYRRYDLGGLTAKLESCGFEVVKKMRFNMLGIFGWMVNGKVLQRKKLSNKLLCIFDRLVPVIGWIEGLIGPPLGLSIIMICKKR